MGIQDLMELAKKKGIQTVPIKGYKPTISVGKGGATIGLTGVEEKDPLDAALKQQQLTKGAIEIARAKNPIKEAVDKESAIRSGKLKELNKLVSFFESKINEVPSGKGLVGRAVGAQNVMQAWLQTDPKIAAYQSSLDGSKALIARGLGDVGNLSETEQKNAVKLLPEITDNEETRKQKIKNFRDMLKFKGLDTGENSTKTKPKDDPLGVF